MLLFLVLACFAAESVACASLCVSTEVSCSDCSKCYNLSESSNVSISVSDSKVHFDPSFLDLTGVSITIHDASNVEIGSAENKNVITCIGLSGVYLRNVTNASMHSLEFISCGRDFSPAYSDNVAFSVILIEDSNSVNASRLSFINSSGSGLIMLNVGGEMALTHCSFKNSTSKNVVNQTLINTGALHIEMSTCSWSLLKETTTVCENTTVIQNSVLLISECDFIANVATGNVQGGGLFIETAGKSASNRVTIKDCYFGFNCAFRGGGACIRMDDNVLGNTIQIIDVEFTSNLSPSIGGGIVVGFAFNQLLPQGNQVILSGCTFLNNKAELHAGASVYSSSSSSKSISENSVQFRDCRWIKNSASSLGAALGVVAIYNKDNNSNIIVNQQFIEILLRNAEFFGNEFTDSFGSAVGVRSGVVHITTIPVKFEGDTRFSSNNGTALEIISSSVHFQRSAHVTFEDNRASPNGAAVNLIQTSTINVNKNTVVTFSNNTACSGAAIKQHTTDPYDFIHSRKCFVKYTDSSGNWDIPSFIFINNTATCEGFGNSIHLPTLRPCNYTYSGPVGGKKCHPVFSNTSIFSCVANFTFLGKHRTEITTDAQEIVTTSAVLAMPGIEVDLPIYAVDELRNKLPVVYTVVVTGGNIKLDEAYKYITKTKSKFFGEPGSKGIVHLTASSARNQVETHLAVTLSQCQPGYVLDDARQACKCSSVAKQSQRYSCITKCNEASIIAVLEQNWWMNFDVHHPSEARREDRFICGHCPEDHCSSSTLLRELRLSGKNDSKLDDIFICHPTRTGRLCSQCRENYTTHYHSNSYKCGSKSTCKWGGVLFVISELLPVTCLLLLIILFDIKLTAGVVSGLIYFAQTIDKIVLNDVSRHFAASKLTRVLLDGYALIVRMFNLNFFQLDATSYCLWDGAQTLDMMMFHYVTTIYSLLLVFVVIAVAHYCSMKKCFKGVASKVRRKRLTVRNTLIHGITGFLILSYSGFTSTSVNLLLSVSLFSKGHEVKYTAVYYNGELTHMKGKHLFYALPAVFVFIILGLLPPLLLISYPLCYKILTWLKLNESKFSRALCTCIPLEKMKPLFDSFQSSFKDEYRFFSGLYFIFRLSTFSIQAATGGTSHFYSAISVQSAVIFALHAVCRPYKNKNHNLIEGVLLFDITLIAIFSESLRVHFNNSNIVGMWLSLLYLPLLIVTIYAGKAIWQTMKNIKASMKCRPRDNCDYQEFHDSVLFREAENRLAIP